MNTIKPEYRARAVILFKEGMSVRHIRKLTGLAHNTLLIIRKEIIDQLPLCGCGQPSGHSGWCKPRFQDSSRRQKALAKLHAKQRGSLQEIEQSFIKGAEMLAMGKPCYGIAIEALKAKLETIYKQAEELVDTICMLQDVQADMAYDSYLSKEQKT